MKLKHITKRAVTFLLAVVLLTGCLIPYAANNETAQETGGIPDPLISTTSNNDALPELSTDSTLLSDPESLAEAEAAYRERMQRERAEGILADSKIADYVNTDEFFETKPMFRLTALETLNSYVVQNADNTNTIYFMSENVKYVDAKGEIREKDVRLSATEKGFAVTDSDVKLLLPAKISDGISVNTGFGSITLAPLFLGDSTVILDEKSNSVRYDGAFGNGTFLRYTPTLSGVKEDIILETRPEENSFEFRMETQGLYLAEEDGIYYLVSTDNKDSRIRLNQIYIYDANGRFTAGEMSVIDEGRGKFLLTVAAPREFLDDANTAYPVVIDPSFTINTNQYSSNIIDAAVHQNKPNMNAGTWQYDNIGYTDSTYGLARTVIKLSALLSDSTYQSLTASQINSVTFSAMEATGNSSKTVKLHPITGSPTWTESTVTWNNYGSFDTTVNYGGTLTGDQRTSFNITNLVKAWKNGSYNGNGCFIFIMGGTENSQCRALYSMEYSETTNRPYVSMTYNTTVSINPNPIYVKENTLALPVCSFSSTGTYYYEWSVSDTSLAGCIASNLNYTQVCGIHAGNTILTVTIKDSSNNIIASTCADIIVLIPDGVYYIQNTNSLFYVNTDHHIDEGRLVNQYQLYNTEYDHVAIRQMWIVKHIGSGKYCIRRLYKPDMGLYVDGSQVKVKTIGTSDSLSSISADAQWTFSWNPSYGYKIENYSTIGLMMPQNGSTNLGTNLIIFSTIMTSSSGWQLIKESNPPSGIFLYDNNVNMPAFEGTFNSATGIMEYNKVGYIPPDKNVSLQTGAGLCPVSYCANDYSQNFNWEIIDSTVVQLVDTTPVLKGLESGFSYIVCRKQFTGGGGGAIQFKVVVTDVKEGDYYLVNCSSKRYAGSTVSVEYNGMSANGMDFECYDTYRFTLTLSNYGYYTICTNIDDTDYYLKVSGDSSYDDIPLIYSFGGSTDGAKWKIEALTEYQYKITSCAGLLNAVVMGQNSLTGGAPIIQKYYSNQDSSCMWYIIPARNEIKPEGQLTNNWCWAACAKVATTKFMDSPIGQASAAVYAVSGISTWNPTNAQINSADVGQDVNGCKRAMNYILMSGDSVYTSFNHIYSEQTLVSLLDAGNVVIAARNVNSNGSGGGHDILIIGYEYDSGGTRIFNIYDPLYYFYSGGYLMTYDTIVYGTYSPYLTGTALYWHTVCTFKIGPYQNTINYN